MRVLSILFLLILATSCSPKETIRAGVLTGHQGPVSYARMSEDAGLMYSYSSADGIRVWDPVSHEQLSYIDFEEYGGEYFDFEFDEKLKLFFLFDFATDGTWVIDPLTGNEIDQGKLKGDVRLRLGPRLIVRRHEKKELKVTDRLTGEEVKIFGASAYTYGTPYFSPNRNYIYAHDYAGGINVWKANSYQKVISEQPYIDNAKASTRFAFTKNGERMVTGSSGAHLWSLSSKGHSQRILPSTYLVADAFFTPDERFVFIATKEKGSYFWDIRNEEMATVVEGPPISRIWQSKDGTVLVATNRKGQAQIINVEDQKSVQIVSGMDLNARIYFLGQDDQFVVLDSNGPDRVRSDGSLRPGRQHGGKIYEAATGRQLKPLEQFHSGTYTLATASPDGTVIFSLSKGGVAYLWDALTGEIHTKPLLHRDDINHAMFVDEGRFLVTSSDDRTVRISSIRDLKEQELRMQYPAGR